VSKGVERKREKEKERKRERERGRRDEGCGCALEATTPGTSRLARANLYRKMHPDERRARLDVILIRGTLPVRGENGSARIDSGLIEVCVT